MRRFIIIFILFSSTILFGQTSANEYTPTKQAFEKGEWLQFRMSYSNFLNAGYATLKVKSTKENGNNAFHVLGEGKTSGLVGLLFKVRTITKLIFIKNL